MPSQMLKGILEGCILAIIEKKEVYGYELSMMLQTYDLQVSEGSIYPILLRLQKEGAIEGKMQPSPSGPNRKYYFLTERGKEMVEKFENDWSSMKGSVDHLLEWRNR